MLHQIRNRKNTSKGLAQAGFTIIEVMIVLAIAGLIMAIVFLAIPALQKTNRNTQRKNDVSRVGSLMNDFISNNNGSLPTCLKFAATACPAAAAGATAYNLDLSAEKFSILDTAGISGAAGAAGAAPAAGTSVLTVGTCAAATCNGTTLPAAPALDRMTVWKNADCNNANIPKYNTSARSYAIYYAIEGSTVTGCIQS